jgi:DNA-binding transcriptional MerR regulator
MSHKTFNIKELSEAAKISPRTVRFYISKDLLPPPIKRGRNALYGEEHLKRLLEIKELKAKGMLLKEISLKYRSSNLPSPIITINYQISDDVIVSVRSDIPPWRMNKIKEAIKELIVTWQLRKF